MLDNEPDTNNLLPDEDAPASTPATTTSADPGTTPPPVRRRRAASRPAGPPTSAAVAPPIERVSPGPEPERQPDPEPVVTSHTPVESAPVEPAAAEPAPIDAPAEPTPIDAAAEPVPPTTRAVRKTAAKRPARKAAAAVEGDEPKTRTPRKRATKKTAAPAAEDPVADLLVPAELRATTSSPSLFSATETGPETIVTQPGSDALTEPESEEPEPEPETIDQRLAELAASKATEAEVEFPSGEGVDPVDQAHASSLAGGVELSAAIGEPLAAANPVSDDAEDDEDDVPEGEQDSHDDDASDDGSRRRRRRRGGRRRRRTGADEDATDADQADPDESSSSEAGAGSEPVEESSDAEGDNDGDPDGDSETQRRRRRRRRRRGEDAGSAPDDPTEVVVRVREPRRTAKSNNEAKASNEVTGIEGSTRMEAKRQRRRDGREAGRRRPPILSEAEFLTRRESVSRKMIIRQREDLSQIAVLEDDILVEHYVDRDSAASLIGNVYLGRVQNVLPSMEAAFIDIGRGRNAVLYAGEVDWDSFGAEGHGRKVEKVLKSGQPILVQVSKDPIGAKGARLTNNISMPGRYIVYSPSGHLSGISRKLPDIERKRLRDILADLVGESASVIVRTAAEGASEDELVRDVNRLKAQWEDIERKVAGGSAPQLLYGEPDLTVRIVRDLFTEDFSELIISGNDQANDAYDAVDGYVTHVAPHLKERMRRWDGGADERDVFAAYRLDEQIAKALERKVFLPSGGSLVIDRTEAMTVIDVNTGKFTGSGGNLEATVTSNNLEAAEEIVRQLRLRDIGGIIVIDFIDMVLPANRELLLRRLVECLGRDRTRHQVAEVTSLGLVQMTRKKLGTGLLEAFTSECPHCLGRGVEIHDVPVESQKQADGGTREPKPRDQRRGSGSGGSSSGGSSSAGSRQADPKPHDHAAESATDEQHSSEGDGNGNGEERSGSGRSRRGGGRSRRGASRDQGPPDSDSGTAETHAAEPEHHEPRQDHVSNHSEPQPEPAQG